MERLISAQKEELILSRGGSEGSCLLFHERRSIDEKMATKDGMFSPHLYLDMICVPCL
jgi:hypothetical protein